MSLKEKLHRIDEFQAEILVAGELDADVKKRINYKFRLDWNYHSNSMEGNTLTKEETRSVMVGNLTVGGKPYKDVAEMRGHDDVVQELLKIGKGEVRLSEKRVKDIHRSIMFEEDPKKKDEIGEWKSKDNYVLNYKGERFDFKPHNEVADEMHSLLNFLNAKIDGLEANKEDLHPLETASKFHLWFVSIHPFYDGNGRTARLLTNLFLISQGFPPIIIKTDEKEKYNRYLADIQAYGGSTDLFDEFLADLLIRSQQMVLDAIAGKSIEEPEDIDKEIDLFKRGFEEKTEFEVEKSAKMVAGLFLTRLSRLFGSIEIKHHAISELFSETIYRRIVNDDLRFFGDGKTVSELLFKVKNGEPNDLRDVRLVAGRDMEPELNSVNLYIKHSGFNRKGLDYFNLKHQVDIKFERYVFAVSDNFGFKSNFSYSEPPSKQEMDFMVSEMMRGVMEEIKKKSGNGTS
ncbi:MAG: Fic family protein [Flavobacteriales bacterium]